VVKELISILGAQGTNIINDMGYGQQWNVDQIFLTYLASLNTYLDDFILAQ
jgi:hypothetical protein